MKKEDLVLNNLNLIYMILKQMELYGRSDQQDYYDAGLLGLVKAANIFDPDKGYAFTTIAATCIRNQILQEIKKKKSNRERANYETVSIHQPLGVDDGGKEITLEDVIPSDFDMEEYVIYRDNMRKLRWAIAQLSESDRDLLLYRYGHSEMTQAEIAKIYHTTQSAVSRKICIIIDRIRELIDNEGR